MAYIEQLDPAVASAEQSAAVEDELRLRGRMTNMKWTLAHSPAALRVYGEWFTLRDTLTPVIGDRAIWAFCLAISKAMDNPVGMGFMLRALATPDGEDALVLAPEVLDILEKFGTEIARDPQTISGEIWAALNEEFDAETLVNLVGLAGLMIATNVFTAAVQTAIDPELAPFVAG
jgi:hypothetical protein